MATQILQPPESPNWSAILQVHRNWLSSVVYARLRDRHAVDEVLQETALAASKQPQLAANSEGICKWLYRVAVRQSLLYRRQKFRHRSKVVAAAERGAAGTGGQTDDPHQLLIASEQRELVRMALDKLSSRDCEILMLKYSDGWSCREMAERLGVSESAMKSRLLRARKNLRQQLLNLSDYWEVS